MNKRIVVLNKDEAYKSGIRFPNEVCSPWDMVKAIEWAMEDHVRRFHLEDCNGEEAKTRERQKG